MTRFSRPAPRLPVRLLGSHRPVDTARDGHEAMHSSGRSGPGPTGRRGRSTAGRLSVTTGFIRTVVCCGLLGLATAPAAAQIGTIGAGALFWELPTEPVFYLHAETPPLAEWRGYVTLSWTDESAQPMVMTVAERPVLRNGSAFSALGAGLLWVEATGYEPDLVLASRTVVPLPIPRTSFVVAGSTLPLEDFAWSVALVLDITLFFVR